ncbi:MAG: site-specific integrase [Candidatus Subteraquimicrobiales bacterium]|nr:site-specific integrase [Candidatus Subteraquimicrobiales bacterium]
MLYEKVLEKLNYNHKIKIRLKQRKNSRVIMLEHNSQNKRYYKYLRLYTTGKIDKDKIAFKAAATIRDKMESELINEVARLTVFQSKKMGKQDVTFYDYAVGLVSDKAGKTKSYYLSGIHSFSKMCGSACLISSISEQDIRKWINAMSLSQVTLHNYLRVVKYVLSHAVEDNLITSNPAKTIKIRFPESKREFLSLDEIRIVAEVQFDKPSVQDAFLFSCFTGLRMADVVSLKWSEVKDGYLYHKQSKTGNVERMKLSPTALEILEKQDKSSHCVFVLPSRKHLYLAVNRLMKKASLGKKITFHCGRQTFATMLITNHVELITTQKLLGHRDIRTTLIYSKLVDKLKDEAIDKLPVLKLPDNK